MLEVVSVFTKAFNKHLNWIAIAIEKYLVAEEFEVLKSSNWANKAHLKGLLKGGGKGKFRQEKENSSW